MVRKHLSILKIGAGPHSGSVTLGKSLTLSEHQFAHVTLWIQMGSRVWAGKGWGCWAAWSQGPDGPRFWPFHWASPVPWSITVTQRRGM